VCNSDKGRPINVDNMCIDQQKSLVPEARLSEFMNSSNRVSLNLYGKTKFKVLTTGYECFKEKTKIITYKTFWGYHLTMLERFPEPVSVEDCFEMVKNGRCVTEVNEMKCENDVCRYKDKMKIDHYWLTAKVFEGFECLSKKKLIKAHKQEDSIFVSECKVLDGFCRLENSRVVWHVDNSLFCPFYYIGNSDSDFYADGYNFISHDGKLAFETVSSTVDCDTKFFETSSGIFLSANLPNNLITEQIKKEVFLAEETNYLNLADSDYFKYQSAKEMRKIKWNNCLLYKVLLKSRMSKDTLMLLENGNEKMVLRFTTNNVFRINCDQITQITITNSSNCFDKLAVSYEFNSEIKLGFLGSQGLITDRANVADCSIIEEYYSIPGSNVTIVRENTMVFLTIANNTWSNFNLFDDSEKVSLYHSKMLMEEIQKQEEVERDISPMDRNFLSHVQTIKKDSRLWSFLSKVWNNPITSIATAIIITMVIYIAYKLIQKACKKEKNPESKSAVNETIEMNINIGTNEIAKAKQEVEEKEKATNNVNQDEDLQKKAINLLWESLPSKQNNS